jgi:hypothetical protein
MLLVSMTSNKGIASVAPSLPLQYPSGPAFGQQNGTLIIAAVVGEDKVDIATAL